MSDVMGQFVPNDRGNMFKGTLSLRLLFAVGDSKKSGVGGGSEGSGGTVQVN